MTTGIFTATAGLRSTVDHLFDILIHRLLQVADHRRKLAGGQTLLAGWTGGIRLFEPTERFVDRFVTVRAREVYFGFQGHGLVLPDVLCGDVSAMTESA